MMDGRMVVSAVGVATLACVSLAVQGNERAGARTQPTSTDYALPGREPPGQTFGSSRSTR